MEGTTNPEPSREIEIRLGIPLAGEEQRIVKTLPSDYVQRSVMDAINYALNEAELSEEEELIATQIREEMSTDHILQIRRGGQYTNARKTDPIGRYLEVDPSGKNILDVIIAHIDKGGGNYLLEFYSK
jgi:hypothetical protein